MWACLKRFDSPAFLLISPLGASNEMQMESFNKLTSTARQAYLARMKRLAECVPGREIRAGTRRIRSRQTGFTIKSSSSEQLSRFLQDPSRTQLRLSVLRGADRGKIGHLVRRRPVLSRLDFLISLRHYQCVELFECLPWRDSNPSSWVQERSFLPLTVLI